MNKVISSNRVLCTKAAFERSERKEPIHLFTYSLLCIGLIALSPDSLIAFVKFHNLLQIQNILQNVKMNLKKAETQL